VKLSEIPDTPADAQPKGRKLSEIPEAAPPSGIAGFFRGLLRGGRDVLEGGAQIGARMQAAGPEEGAGAFDVPEQRAALPGRVDQAVSQGEQAYQASPATQAHPLASGLGRIGGNVLASGALTAGLPGGLLAGGAMRGASLPMRMGMGAAQGAAGAAMQPVDPNDDYWSSKGKQVAAGFVVGGALPGAIGALAPKGTAPGTAGQLAAAGVRLTPGMQFGPAARGFEKTLEAFPILGGMLHRGEARSIDGFNKATASQVLEPIGLAVPKNVPAGHPLVSWVKDRLSGAYDKLLPNISFSETGWNGIKNDPKLIQMADEMLSGDQRTRFAKILQSRVTDRIQNGVLSGKSFKQAESELSGLVETFHNTNDSALGDALHNVVMRLRKDLVDQNPTYGKELKNINSAYAMYVRLRDAASVAKQGGKFTPTDLMRSARRLDPSAGHGGYAEGEALMQSFAEAADKTLGKVTAPGTTVPSRSLRHLTELMALGGGTGFLKAGETGAGIGAAAAAASPYVAGLGMRVGGALGRTPGAAQGALSGAAGIGAGQAAPALFPSPKQRTDQRLKVSSRIGDLKNQLFRVSTGDLTEYNDLKSKLAAAQKEYRDLGGMA
jgi:hypothetical protein